MNKKILNKISKYIGDHELIGPGDTVIAGVSGGADSMCMLLLLQELSKKLDLKIIVAHVNHGIRGCDAEKDADFVKDYCERNKIPFELSCKDIPALAKETGTTCEEAGRNYRYAFFKELCEKYGASKIAVAHNSGDNAETVLFNIFRGSGIGGLKGILPERTIREEGRELKIIRPVLILSRQEIEGYLRERGQDYCTDLTNGEDAYTRNRIRNVILPEARKCINSNVMGHLENLSRQAAEVFDLIEQETDKYSYIISETDGSDGTGKPVKIDCAVLKSLHPVLKKSILRRAFEKAAGRLKDVEEVHIVDMLRLAENTSGKKISLPYGIVAVKEYDDLLLIKESVPGKKDVTVELTVADRDTLPAQVPNEDDVKWFDLEKITNEVELRTMREGDYLIIGKDAHKKSLKRFMIDSKIPLHEREGILLLTEGNHVLWVVGYRRDDSCFISGTTQKVLIAKKKHL